ncbi:MAG: TIR domain-containing protein [Bryobacterales bacterium]|nr:TIR domain-containing protein [Bryobacterales bacterium]
MTRATMDELARILRQCLSEGRRVEIDGLGTFRADGGDFQFVPDSRRRVFLAYAVEDASKVELLYDALAVRGFEPWMDRRKLLPGQNWPRAIERAIRSCDFFVPCFSNLSGEKRGRFHAELRYALDCALNQPLDGVYIVPVRLEECPVPTQIQEQLQYVDLFPDLDAGLDRMTESMLRRRSG